MDSLNEELLLDGGKFFRDNTGAFVQDTEGRYLVIKDSNLIWMELVLDEPSDNAESNVVTEETLEETKCSKSTTEMSNSAKKQKNTWSRPQTSALIAFYKEHVEDFASSKMKHDVIWRQFEAQQSHEEGYHDLQQIKDKWAALKQLFFKKVDNMSAKASGSAPVKFDYFDEMYEIFRDNPRVTPIGIASSSRKVHSEFPKKLQKKRKNDTFEDDLDDEDVMEKEPTVLPRGKKTKFEAYLEKVAEDQKKREEANEKRHQKAMELQSACLNVFQDVAKIMKDSFTNKGS